MIRISNELHFDPSAQESPQQTEIIIRRRTTKETAERSLIPFKNTILDQFSRSSHVPERRATFSRSAAEGDRTRGYKSSLMFPEYRST